MRHISRMFRYVLRQQRQHQAVAIVSDRVERWAAQYRAAGVDHGTAVAKARADARAARQARGGRP